MSLNKETETKKTKTTTSKRKLNEQLGVSLKKFAYKLNFWFLIEVIPKKIISLIL